MKLWLPILSTALQHHGNQSLLAVETTTVMQSGSTLGIIHKSEYWGTILVGTPPEEYTVIFDTGSGNLIIPGKNCDAVACKNHKRYGASSTISSTSVPVGKEGKSLSDVPEQEQEAVIRFGTGQIHGQFYSDSLCLGQNACVKANFIATTDETDEPFVSCAFDGIMGLGFSDLSMGPGFNIVDELVRTHALNKNQISVYLTDKSGSELNLGGYKPEHAASPLFWVPVSFQSYWQIKIDDIAFNNIPQSLCENCQVAVDTGTSLLAGPSDVVAALEEKLDVKADCSNFDSLPSLGFVVGEKVLNLVPDDYISRSGSNCELSLMALDVPPPKGPLFVFGDPFLRRFLTVFDRDGPSVGFAVAAQEGEVDSSSVIGMLGQEHAKRIEAEPSAGNTVVSYSRALHGAAAGRNEGFAKERPEPPRDESNSLADIVKKLQQDDVALIQSKLLSIPLQRTLSRHARDHNLSRHAHVRTPTHTRGRRRTIKAH